MSLISRLESKFGRFAVPNIMALIVGGQVLVYVFSLVQEANGQANGLLFQIMLIPELVWAGEVWRLVTFMFQPPRMSPIFLFFYWYLLYFFGTTLEQQWGTFRFNAYLFVGYVATVIVSLFLPVGAATNSYLYTSVFLAFARLYPDFELRIYFLIPVKVKWLALLIWLSFAFQIYSFGWPAFLLVAVTVINFVLFLGKSIWQQARDRQRRHDFQRRTAKASKRLVHECRVCGLTSKMEPRMQFRYCSECEGQCCYCSEHIGKHEHVVA